MEKFMKRVTGIGGVFFQAKDAAALQAWYKRHLGIDVQEWGGTAFRWVDSEGQPTGGSTIWSVSSVDSEMFAPGNATFMINYRVDNLDELLTQLRDGGVEIVSGPESHENGKFAWILDLDGNKVELWEPKIWDEKNKEG